MSYVCLGNLFESDKNFHGLLEECFDLTPPLTITPFGEKAITESAKKIITELNGKTIRELSRSIISDPEWCLTVDGTLANAGVFTQGTHVSFERLFEIDISDWLATLSDEQLHSIADCMFIDWVRDKDENIQHPLNHPRYSCDASCQKKKRLTAEQEKFFANIAAKRKGNENV